MHFTPMMMPLPLPTVLAIACGGLAGLIAREIAKGFHAPPGGGPRP